ncbi:inositol monophosphatase family protein [Streptomyces sp. NPDC058301]|uniref:inositol monophosphatase family protein n=1 Tax=Streptomyces sp. NPDC058301 TaxID=3346436 RepID=UPI0036E96BCE
MSLGLIENDRAVLGVIDLPFLGQRFKAGAGHGTYADGSRIAVSRTKVLSEAIFGMGDYAVGEHAQQRNVRRLALTGRLAENVLRVRMLGSAALDLVWVASGKLDASIALSNHPWDMVAGVAIAREAGADVVDINGTAHDLRSAATIAVTPGLRDPVLGLVSAL